MSTFGTRQAQKAELAFTFDVSGISRVHGWNLDAGQVSTVACVLRGNSHLLDGAYVEVKTIIINTVTYRGGRFWAELRNGAWQPTSMLLDSPVGVYENPTRNAQERFARVADAIAASLPELDGLTDVLVSAARWEATNILKRQQQDLAELEAERQKLAQRELQARTTIQLVESVIHELEDGITGAHHRHLLAFLEAGHSFTDAIAAARALS